MSASADARAPDADVWLILPTYNEAANIESFVAEVRERLPPRAGC